MILLPPAMTVQALPGHSVTKTPVLLYKQTLLVKASRIMHYMFLTCVRSKVEISDRRPKVRWALSTHIK